MTSSLDIQIIKKSERISRLPRGSSNGVFESLFAAGMCTAV